MNFIEKSLTEQPIARQTMTKKIKPLRILAITSGGGHWVQLMRLRPSFADLNVHYATVDASNRNDVSSAPFYRIPDANRSQKFKLILLIFRVAWVMLRVRPQAIVTTGAAPGYLAIRLGKLFGCRSLFLDSMANAEYLSLSARLAARHTDLLMTQWPHLDKKYGARFRGAVV
jgi:UDP-N-acetylglucosamine:LPS N-acetylglucosamine transferase